ncbi:RNA polymerase sigma factor [soil metagenome]
MNTFDLNINLHNFLRSGYFYPAPGISRFSLSAIVDAIKISSDAFRSKITGYISDNTALVETENLLSKQDNEGEQKFALIVEQFKDKAYALALKILKNKEEAEDCLQDSFIKLYKALESNQFESRSKLSTYIYTIVYNTAVDHYKKKKTRDYSLISIDINDSNFNENDELTDIYYKSIKEESRNEKRNDPMEITSSSEIGSLVNKFISILPEHYSVILNLFFINDLTHEEISTMLKLPTGTVKNRIFRAKDSLKKLIQEKYSEEEIKEMI